MTALRCPLLADIVRSNDLDFLCLTETHVCPSDSDCLVMTLENYGMCYILNRVSEMTLPSHESDKLDDQFASFFSNKIKTIKDTFVPPGTENDVHPPSDPLKIYTSFLRHC